MSDDRSSLYRQAKEAGVKLDKPYASYRASELKTLIAEHEAAALMSAATVAAEEVVETPAPATPVAEAAPTPRSATRGAAPAPATPAAPRVAERATQGHPARAARNPETLEELEMVVAAYTARGALVEGTEIKYRNYTVPVISRGADRAGLTHDYPADRPLRVDLQGRIWFRDDVPKPAIPRARMTRKTRYTDSGVKEERTYHDDGRIDEIYEVAGEESRELTVTTTLPSYQVGRYKDSRFPFMIHVYNQQQGFDYSDVIEYYGGRELVPGTIKTVYIGNMLCFHISSTVQTIENSYSQLMRRS